jgi:hypothetical protein
MKRFLKKLGVTGAAYAQWSGCQPLNQFGKDNPTWTQRAWEVLVLENLDTLGGAIPQTATKRPVPDRRHSEKMALRGETVVSGSRA